MSQFFQLHPKDPQPRLIKRVGEILRANGLIVYPTDSSYAFGCRIDNKDGLDRICRLRRLGEDHHFTLICKDLAQVSTYAKMNNEGFRLIKSLTPGSFTFILEATRETPRRMQHIKRKTIGIRLPDDAITAAILAELDEPLFSSTLLLPEHDDPMSDPEDIRDRLEKDVELVIDSGVVPYNPTTIIDLTGTHPEIVRQGVGVADSLR
jgi:tRNA threonylcarbamoyl adenosine modification protein (Sua5/YciO/YrdC/YwlC family)